ncbi:hypothetical protein DPEC_G00076590 [Dallia pectoralis]|uniref:Uncharacterized protein n=1 Tax=Dallia pectoralis TaxID=75939 RepID=A0ACC2H3L9_DALPE|nr:hypothetical protein DPEC_G00076590 [Dallia pectoralis]
MVKPTGNPTHVVVYLDQLSGRRGKRMAQEEGPSGVVWAPAQPSFFGVNELPPALAANRGYLVPLMKCKWAVMSTITATGETLAASVLHTLSTPRPDGQAPAQGRRTEWRPGARVRGDPGGQDALSGRGESGDATGGDGGHSQLVD